MAVCCIVNKICDCHDLSSKSANMQKKKKRLIRVISLMKLKNKQREFINFDA